MSELLNNADHRKGILRDLLVRLHRGESPELLTPITPETKVATFLEAYPHMQDELIACSAAFAKLRNPVLRRTVARVTSLRQAAMVGGLGKMAPGGIDEVSAPFLPVPMIEKAASLGYLHWVRTAEGGCVVVAFGAPLETP